VNANGDGRRPPEEEESVEGGALMELPSFDAGGRVDRTGIALVHEGEWIRPAPGSEAAVAPLPGETPQGQVVAYHFPVEVEVVGELSETQRREVANHVYDELDAALRARG
jgi:hypothetical protein